MECLPLLPNLNIWVINSTRKILGLAYIYEFTELQYSVKDEFVTHWKVRAAVLEKLFKVTSWVTRPYRNMNTWLNVDFCVPSYVSSGPTLCCQQRSPPNLDSREDQSRYLAESRLCHRLSKAKTKRLCYWFLNDTTYCFQTYLLNLKGIRKRLENFQFFWPVW